MDSLPTVELIPVGPHDLEDLIAIRIEAMRESLERIGRFDPGRARQRFADSFSPAETRYILHGDDRVGFLATKQQATLLLLDHLYIRPSFQRRRIGAAVLQLVFAGADACRLPVRVGALRESDSNRFYLRHGFQLVEQDEFDNYYLRDVVASDSSTRRSL